MIRGIPVFVTFDGEGHTARFDPKSGTIADNRTLHPAESRELIRAFHRPLIVVLRDQQDFGQNENGSYCSLLDPELIEWCNETTGINFGGVVTASESLIALTTAVKSSVIKQCRLIYELEGHIIFLLVIAGKAVSQIRIAAIESEIGWDRLITRCDRWYTEQGITGSVESFWLGQFSYALTPEPYRHLFPEIQTPELAAAGASLLDISQIHNGPSRKKVLIRQFRLISLVGSVCFLALTVGLTLYSVIYGAILTHSSASLQSQISLTPEQSRYRDSLTSVAERIIKLDRQRKTNHRWSEILTDLAAVPHKDVTINQLGSRQIETGLELAFDGEGKSETSVTAFITSLKASSRFSAIQLNQFDRIEGGGYRFRVQCTIK